MVLKGVRRIELFLDIISNTRLKILCPRVVSTEVERVQCYENSVSHFLGPFHHYSASERHFDIAVISFRCYK